MTEDAPEYAILEESPEEDLFLTLVQIVKSMGWSVCIPNIEDDEMVPGMIIGTDEYVNDILNKIEKND